MTESVRSYDLQQEPLGWSEKWEPARKYMVHNVTLKIYCEQVSINMEGGNLSN